MRVSPPAEGSVRSLTLAWSFCGLTSQPLSEAQAERLRATLAEKSGKIVKLNARVDESLIGGMIVKLGSSMVDSSIRSRLSALQNAMKEVG